MSSSHIPAGRQQSTSMQKQQSAEVSGAWGEGGKGEEGASPAASG